MRRAGCRALMVQGTGSHVGKSLFVAGLSRAFHRRGFRVAPFKPQNMSNNAAVAADGGEIGRAQALQALAAKQRPSIHMNPVLLKPEHDEGSALIIRGRHRGRVRAREYYTMKASLLPVVLDSFKTLAETSDLILVEGAGSPAEVNLREGDIANMGFALEAGLPVILIGDIERGGVIAALLGSWMLMSEDEKRLLKGFVINKFRGDKTLFSPAETILKDSSGMRCFGILPWFPEAQSLPEEDSLALAGDGADSALASGTGKTQGQKQAPITIAVLRFPRIANFDDFTPLADNPDVNLRFIAPGRVIPAESDLVILPGSKSVFGDLETLYEQQWDIDLRAHIRRRGAVLGICGGYQMLGETIADPDGVEGQPGRTTQGLACFPVHTVLKPEKTTAETVWHLADDPCAVIAGYEIHHGETGPQSAGTVLRPFLRNSNGEAQGAVSADGRIIGCYLHGMFGHADFTECFFRRLFPVRVTGRNHHAQTDLVLDNLADHIETHCQVETLLNLAQEVRL